MDFLNFDVVDDVEVVTFESIPEHEAIGPGGMQED